MADVTCENWNQLPGYLVPVAKAYVRNFTSSSISVPRISPQDSIPEEELVIQGIEGAVVAPFLITQARQLARYGFVSGGTPPS